ncbi:MAG: DUF1638 domain-containing protein [Actinobacteria bacterium]|nr:DUF1638 domain-containing protein [Actinomycetota bacterium]
MAIAAIIACEMIEDETLLAVDRAYPEGGSPPIVWIESSLHERPEKLQSALLAVIEALDVGARAREPVMVPSVRVSEESADFGKGGGTPARREELVQVGPQGDILLGFGYCGGGLKQLVSHERRLVFPRVDDCISLFLDGGYDRGRATRDPHSYYLTKGWFCHQGAMTDGYDAWVERYGLERAAQIRRLMFANYERISLIDTGAYSIDEWLPHSETRATELELSHEIVPGSVRLLERLFAGDWDEDVIVLEPGQPIGIEHLLCFEA